MISGKGGIFMIKYIKNRYVLLKVKSLRSIVTQNHPELLKDPDVHSKIEITHDRFQRYLASKDETIRIETRTGLNLCNYLNVSPHLILVTDGSISHSIDESNPQDSYSNQHSLQEEILYLSDYVDDPLKMASLSLVKPSGSPERVSYAIAGIAGYLRSIVARVPELKNHTQCILTSITPALSSSFLDSNKNTVNILCGNIRSNIAALLETDSIPTHARIEADSIMHLLTESRLSDDNVKRLSAIKLLLFWLHDYWQYVCQSLYAYYLLNDICCVLSGAPVDYETRSNIVARINEFAMYVSRLDPINKFAIT